MLFRSCHLILFVSSTNYFQMVRRQCCLVLDILTPFSSSWTRVQIIRAVSEHGNAINTKRSYPPCHSRIKVWGKYQFEYKYKYKYNCKYKFKYLASLSTLPLCSRTSHTQATWRSIITHIFKHTLQIQIQKREIQIHKYKKPALVWSRSWWGRRSWRWEGRGGSWWGLTTAIVVNIKSI